MVLDLELRFLIDGAWTDVTEHLSVANPLTYNHGRPDEASQSDPSQCALTLVDPDGRFVEDNPRSDLFGNFGRGTLGYVKWGSTGDNYVDMPGTTAQFTFVPDSAALDTGTTRLRFTVEAEAASGQWGEEPVDLYFDTRVLLSRWEADNTARSWRFYITREGFLGVDITADGSTITTYLSTVSLGSTGVTGRVKLRAYYDGTNWVFEYDDLVAGFVQLGAAVAGSISVKNVNVATRIGSQGVDATNPAAPFHGHVYRATVESGVGFPTVLFDADFRSAAVAVSPLPDGTVVGGGAVLVDPDLVFLGEVVSTSQVGDKAEATMFTSVVLAGVSQRLNHPDAPAASVYRASTQPYAGTDELVAYWPCEDPEGSTSFASVVEGVDALIPHAGTGTLVLPDAAADDEWVSSDALPTWHTGGVWATFSDFLPETDEMTFSFFTRVPVAGFTAAVDWARIFAIGGDVTHVVVGFETNGDVSLSIRHDGGDTNFTADLDLPGRAAFVMLTLRPLPATPTSMEWRLTSFFEDGSSATATNSMATTNFGALEGFDTQPFGDGVWLDGDLEGATFGHIQLWNRARIGDEFPEFTDNLQARFTAFDGESAGARIVRRVAEEGVPLRIEGHAVDTMPMGPMQRGSLAEQRLAAELVDGGILYDSPNSYSFVYRTRRSVMEADVLEVDYTDGVVDDPWSPVWDDQGIRNDVTVKRTGGGSARSVLEEGPRSVQDPPLGSRRWAVEEERELATDLDLQPYADWLLGLGTAPGSRMPELGFNLGNSRTNSLYGAALRRTRPGDRLRVLNPPAWMHPDPVELAVQQVSWTLQPGTDVATVALTCTPGEPWMVAFASPDDAAAADEFEPHVDTADAHLVDTIDDVETTITVASFADLPFSEDPDDLAGGCLLRFGGPQGPTDETVNLTAVDPFLVDAFGRTVASGWGSPDTGPAWNNFASGSAGTSVGGGLGLLSTVGASSDAGVYTSANGDGWEVEGEFSLSALPTGASLLVAFRTNWDTGVGTFYQVGLTISTAGAVTMECGKVVAGVFSATSSAVLPFTLAALTSYSFRISAKDGRVRGLVLPTTSWSGASGWQVELSGDGAVIFPGSFGLYAFRGVGATNSPNVRFDNLQSLSPQVFTVDRGWWGWASAHTFLTPVSLRYPWRVGL